MNEVTVEITSELELVDDTRLLLNVDTNGLKVTQWAELHREEIERLVLKNGAVLIRGLKILSSKQFGQVLTTLFGEELIQYSYRSTPRTELRGNVYTTTEYHPDQVIPQHNENAYSNQWAMRIGFLCMLPSQEGGETPISDSRNVYQKIPKEIRDEFEQKKIRYVRNYSELDLPWSEVFQSEDRSVVEAYCKSNRLQYEWLENNALRTIQVNPASARHPITQEKVWFNQAHLFHVSNLEKQVRDSLLSVMDEESLPRNAYFGDGSPIDPEVLQLIRDIYIDEQISFPWQKHDLLILDNMLSTHGRNPYKGERKVLVGMSRPFSL